MKSITYKTSTIPGKMNIIAINTNKQPLEKKFTKFIFRLILFSVWFSEIPWALKNTDAE